MNKFGFSFSKSNTRFSWYESEKIINVPKGIADVLSGMNADTILSEWHLEMMIYRTEEIIEFDSTIKPIHGKAIIFDNFFNDVCKSYFAHSKVITPDIIESVFNKVADDISYKPFLLSSEQLNTLAYLVFVREITHHLDITSIKQG